MPGKILVTTDFSDESVLAFSHAKEQAMIERSSILLVTILEDYFVPSLMYPEIAPIPDIEEYRKKAVDATATRLADVVAKHFSGADVESRVVVSAKSAGTAIADIAREEQCKIIVIASHGRGALGTLFMGSTVQRLLQEASCPLLVVPRQKKEK